MNRFLSIFTLIPLVALVTAIVLLARQPLAGPEAGAEATGSEQHRELGASGQTAGTGVHEEKMDTTGPALGGKTAAAQVDAGKIAALEETLAARIREIELLKLEISLLKDTNRTLATALEAMQKQAADLDLENQQLRGVTGGNAGEEKARGPLPTAPSKAAAAPGVDLPADAHGLGAPEKELRNLCVERQMKLPVEQRTLEMGPNDAASAGVLPMPEGTLNLQTILTALPPALLPDQQTLWGGETYLAYARGQVYPLAQEWFDRRLHPTLANRTIQDKFQVLLIRNAEGGNGTVGSGPTNVTMELRFGTARVGLATFTSEDGQMLAGLRSAKEKGLAVNVIGEIQGAWLIARTSTLAGVADSPATPMQLALQLKNVRFQH